MMYLYRLSLLELSVTYESVTSERCGYIIISRMPVSHSLGLVLSRRKRSFSLSSRCLVSEPKQHSHSSRSESMGSSKRSSHETTRHSRVYHDLAKNEHSRSSSSSSDHSIQTSSPQKASQPLPSRPNIAIGMRLVMRSSGLAIRDLTSIASSLLSIHPSQVMR